MRREVHQEILNVLRQLTREVLACGKARTEIYDTSFQPMILIHEVRQCHALPRKGTNLDGQICILSRPIQTYIFHLVDKTSNLVVVADVGWTERKFHLRGGSDVYAAVLILYNHSILIYAVFEPPLCVLFLPLDLARDVVIDRTLRDHRTS